MSAPAPAQSRRLAFIAIAIAAALVIGAIVLLTRPGGPTAGVPSPTVTASPTPSSSATPSPSVTASTTSTAASGRFVNSALGYSIQLPPGWRRTPCLSNSEDPRTPEGLGTDTFTSVPVVEESYGDVGPPVDTVSVRVEQNPSRLSADEWARSPRMPTSSAQTIEPRTLAGRAGVRISGGVSPTETTVVTIDDLVYVVGFTARFAGDPNAGTMRAIVESFAFVPRTARPAATAGPPRSVETVADGLADGFARKDVAALSRLTGDCVINGAEQGGFGTMSRERFAGLLREVFAAGTTVVVRSRPIESAPGYGPDPSVAVATTWTDPGKAPAREDLIIGTEGAFSYWRGMVRRQGPPP